MQLQGRCAILRRIVHRIRGHLKINNLKKANDRRTDFHLSGASTWALIAKAGIRLGSQGWGSTDKLDSTLARAEAGACQMQSTVGY